MATMTTEFAEFLLSDGSGYIGYWADLTASTLDENGLTSITIDEQDGDVKGKTITLADVKTAGAKLTELVKAGKFYGCCTGCTDEFVGRASEGIEPYEGYDACTADAVLQLAALGEIVYG